MSDQDNFYLISLNILITCLLDNVRISWREVTCQSLLEVKGLKISHPKFGMQHLGSYPSQSYSEIF